jgi:hypothetical protein
MHGSLYIALADKNGTVVLLPEDGGNGSTRIHATVISDEQREVILLRLVDSCVDFTSRTSQFLPRVEGKNVISNLAFV